MKAILIKPNLILKPSLTKEFETKRFFLNGFYSVRQTDGRDRKTARRPPSRRIRDEPIQRLDFRLAAGENTASISFIINKFNATVFKEISL